MIDKENYFKNSPIQEAQNLLTSAERNTDAKRKLEQKYKNHTIELKFSTGHYLQMIAKGRIAQSQQHKPLKKIFLYA